MLQTGLDLTAGGLKSSVTTDVTGGGTGTFTGLTVANGDLTIADSAGNAKALEQPCTLTIVRAGAGIGGAGGSATATVAGEGFAVGDTITIAKASIGTPAADAVITIDAADLQSATVPAYRYIPVEDILYVVPLFKRPPAPPPPPLSVEPPPPPAITTALTTLTAAGVQYVPVAVTLATLHFPKEVGLSFPIIPPCERPALAIDVLLCGHPS